MFLPQRITLVGTIPFVLPACNVPRSIHDNAVAVDPGTPDALTATASIRPEDKAKREDLGPQLRFFEPSARVYFDYPKDNDSPDEEIDIFQDGALAPAIEIGAVYWAQPYWGWLGRGDWTWGPSLGLGLGNPADGAPVVLATAGLLLEFGPKTPLAVEVGIATGFSAEEDVADADDTGIYVGFRLGKGWRNLFNAESEPESKPTTAIAAF